MDSACSYEILINITPNVSYRAESLQWTLCSVYSLFSPLHQNLLFHVDYLMNNKEYPGLNLLILINSRKELLMKLILKVLMMTTFMFIVNAIMLVCPGCGHNTFSEIKTVGLDATIPVYSTPVGVRVGQSEITMAAVRGNTSFSSQSTTGGGLLATTAGTGKVHVLKSGPQVNEGYIKDIMTSPDVPAEAKVVIAKHYLTTPAPEVQPAVTKTLGAATGSGDTPPKVEPIRTGVDNVVDKVAEAAPKVVPPIADATKEVVNNTVTTVGDTATSTMDNVKSIVRWVVIALVFIIVLAGIIYITQYIKKHKKTKQSQEPVETTTDTQDNK